MPDPHPNQLLSLCNIDLDLAVDALLSDHLHRLTTLLQGFRRSQITEDDAVDVLEEALERRSFARRFEANLHLDEEDEDGHSATLPDVGGRVDGSVVSLLSSLELSEDQRKRHENWTPMEDERVLVWVSKERPAWPGKVRSPNRFRRGKRTSHSFPLRCRSCRWNTSRKIVCQTYQEIKRSRSIFTTSNHHRKTHPQVQSIYQLT